MAAGEARPIADDDQTEPATPVLVPVSTGPPSVGDRTATTTDAEGAGAAPVHAAAAPAHAGTAHASTGALTPDTCTPPDPGDTARALGLCVVEVLTGGREVDSIARWITEDVQRHLLQRAALAARARSIGRRSRARPILQVGSVRVCEPAPGVAEAAVVVHTRSHARAVALRLEFRQGRWRATAVAVL